MSASRTTVRIGDRTKEVSIERRDDQVVARVDGREYRLSVLEAPRNAYSFLPLGEGGLSVEAVVHEKDGVYRVRVRDREFLAVIDRPGQAARVHAAAAGPRLLRSVMPGRIVRVLAGPGTAVKRGQGIIVVEAMKMENELGAPGDGVVREILAAPGDRIEAGATLAVIE